MSHVFISYSRQNKDYARQLADTLITEGFDVWIDDRINYGENWWKVIVRAIRDCHAFVVIMTPESETSDWVQREVLVAEELKKPAFPLLLEGKLIDFDHFLIYISTQYTDITHKQLPGEKFYARLSQVCERRSTSGREIVSIPYNEIGLRFDGVYQWLGQGSLYRDCLKFNEDKTAMVFMLDAHENISHEHLEDVQTIVPYESQEGRIQIKLDRGRNYTGQIQDDKLILKVQYPSSLKPEYRDYQFIPFR